MEFRKATEADLPRIWEIILQAKAQMFREGKQQWTEEYPAPENIRQDIGQGAAHVLCWEGTVVAYGAVVFTGEPAYEALRGEWLSLQPYVVLHRLAVADEAKRQGMAVHFMQEVERLALSQSIHSFKVDTNYDNFYMQRVLARCGFTLCGEVDYSRGSRKAYEKLLQDSYASS